MKTQPHYSQVPQTEGQMEPFPQPRTIPDGWDLTDMLAAADAGGKNSIKAGFDYYLAPQNPNETGRDLWNSR